MTAPLEADRAIYPDTSSSSRDSPEDRVSTPRGRRAFLRTAGAVAVTGALAGCSDDGSGGNGDGPDSVDDWLSGTGNYDSVQDRTGRSSVTVEVGARGNNGANAFAPAAVEVSPGTTVTWEWVDGHHNVVATDGSFDSGTPERDATFSHTFDSPGTFYYYCDPHRSIDMKGAVVVTDPDGDGDARNAIR